MRREWSGWIKARQWGEFERLAKTEPNQSLADIVAELERGFPDKVDRKALRKVLFLLSQAGFRPEPIEGDEADVAPTPLELGFLVSADGFGDAVVSYGVQEGRKVRWLVAHINGRTGITNGSEEDFTEEEAKNRAKTMLTSPPKPFVSAEIPPALAVGMLAQAISISKGKLPTVVASWRSRLRDVEMPPHPAETMPRTEADAGARRRVPMMMDATLLWRLELGTAAPLLRDLYDAQTEGISDEEKEARTESALAQARRHAFTPEVILDHEYRLRDLAYLLHLTGQEGSGILLNALDDLRARGPESDYASGMMDKTTVLLAETLRSSRPSNSRS